MLNVIIGFILGLMSGIFVEYFGRLLWEGHQRRTLAKGLIAELMLLDKEIREYKTPNEAPIYSNSASQLHLFKEQTIQNLQIVYSNILRKYLRPGKHSEIEELSKKIQNTIALLEKEKKIN